MRYLPHTEEEIQEMLEVVGKESLDDLFSSVPAECRYQGDIPIPAALTEWQLKDHFAALMSKNRVNQEHKVLIGAGSYDHYVPEILPSLMSRSEFLTAYTPYQPEVAQGTLQGIFEYQTLTARLLGTDAVNASMYDGASALAESALMSFRIARKKKTVALSAAIHPHYREVVATYLQATDFTIIELPVDAEGRTDLSSLAGIEGLASVAIQSPNFFGVVEDLQGCGEKIHDVDALFISCFSEALAYGLLKSPGECGADIICGEGQSFGLGRSYGGPGVGMMGCRDKLVRNMPGRIVGQTLDTKGKRGFVLTLATREQHIRREKATSNICSNQGICAMTAGMYMATLGGTGIRQLARLNYDKAAYLRSELIKLGAKPLFDAPVFNEFALRFPFDFERVREALKEESVVAGLSLEAYYPDLQGAYLFCATETLKKEDIDRIVSSIKKHALQEV
ncbi:aminomethyl-transferring glycine dehydrogenase subunit GcvPA [Desulfotalea psychrophila]|uniref:Probable glycine dehydrogenase (decarboxylating) subunit 1 n=1 Tax=Desulfotalea psychrophila (strain LSv54 / DSM 12343) TaxID=177439 RepID=GCSPA_DESPS|nr:aminomethyl-transferring glycine dehydrogenase subunit GcvPA [Desulfotalea psychrophila]Q6ARJ7.1 RecName: Full=Probable glycine dehydrogenase (decarboxylating) subunit 1; AltName: Full=Glycine cleavage system P-protein subunit 1; AltName: Full=Glycine decarboxylase subunit 1; AltName: Full=Glycine dehydrogenase (aminomethyl-transferring) subunit 1 [Desulfotalea psychrophila LSv54]CAG35028.1 probable glycine dehydrogenase, subunit 1 [Desulfotalea psychrophila LSv54]